MNMLGAESKGVKYFSKQAPARGAGTVVRLVSLSRPRNRLGTAHVGSHIEAFHLLPSGGPGAEAVEVEIDDRRGVEGEHLAHHEASHNSNPQGAANLRAVPMSNRQRDAAEHGSHGGHHDGPEAQLASLVDGVFGTHALIPFCIDSKV